MGKPKMPVRTDEPAAVWVDRSALHAWAENPRKNDGDPVKKVMESIKRFGFAAPIVARTNGEVIAGHTRLKAAEALGLDRVPVRYMDLDPAEAHLLALADNKLNEEAEWDSAAVASILSDYSLDDAALAGWDSDDLEKLADELGANEPKEVVEDEVPEPPAEPVTKPGDLWLLGEHRLLCGDSTKAEDVARLMAGAKADLCFTSPPYNLGKSVGLRNGARSGAKSAYNENADNDAEDWSRLMQSFVRIAMSRCDLVAVNVQMLSGNKLQLLSLFGEFASHTVDIAIWCKSNPQPAMAENVMNSAFEFVWFLSAEDRPTRAIPTAVFERGTFSNVIESATVSGHDAAVHGAVFPLAVSSRFVGAMSRKGGCVYEPFCGSGTTLIAAEQLGRRCYGMEISPQYCDVIVKRWETLTGKKAELAS